MNMAKRNEIVSIGFYNFEWRNISYCLPNLLKWWQLFISKLDVKILWKRSCGWTHPVTISNETWSSGQSPVASLSLLSSNPDPRTAPRSCARQIPPKRATTAAANSRLRWDNISPFLFWHLVQWKSWARWIPGSHACGKINTRVNMRSSFH